MTVREAILVLNANTVIACERAGFDSATVKMVEDALDIIENTLQAKEPKLVAANVHKQYNNVLNPNASWVGKYPNCNKKIEGRNLTRFCKFCGQAVK